MRQIAIICAFFIVVMLAVVGCLYIFDVIALAAAKSYMLKFGAAIILLGICSALIALLMGGKTQE